MLGTKKPRIRSDADAEGNLAVLAVRISEGKYDRAALEKQAEHYNGVLVLALAGLLCAIQEQRTRACDVLESLKRVKARFDVGSVPASTTWWQSQQEEATLGRSQEMESSEVEGLPASSASDSWKGATLAQLEGLLSQVSGRWMQPEEAVTLGATQLGQAPTPGASPSGSPASDATAAHAANTSPGASRPEASRTAFVSPEAKPRVWGSEPGTEYLGEGESLRRSQHTTPSSVWSPCRTAWGEAPTFGSPTVELQPETPEGARPGSSLRRTGTRIFCRPVRSEVRVDETRRGRGRTWHCSEISEDEVIFCFAPTEASEDGPLASWSRCHGRFGFSICLHRRFFDSKHVTTVFLHMQMFFHEGLIKTYQKTPSWCLRVLYFASYVRGSSGDSVSAYGCL
ncbi:unnamed protein product [Durusdinium trenchii]|uniref:Uncharacterized protein n=1 Tax=Durusdinium trenchii TaxID=1381693 RepID=A0ABP0KY90_9DINO